MFVNRNRYAFYLRELVKRPVTTRSMRAKVLRVPDTVWGQAVALLGRGPLYLCVWRKWSSSPALCGMSLMEAIMSTPLTPNDIILKLLANGAKSAAGEDIDPIPLVKLFTPDATATWLLTEIDPEVPDIAYGLCDLSLGCPELGSVSLNEITNGRGSLGLSVERDLYYRETRPLSVLAKLARKARRIG